MIRYIVAVVLAGFGLIMSVAHAQEGSRPMLAGPTVGGEMAFDRAEIPVFNNSPECGTYTQGTTYALWLGGNGLLPFGGSWLLDVTLGGGYTASSVTATPVEPMRTFEEGNVIDIDREFELGSKRWRLSLDLLMGYRLSENLTLAVGPSLAYNAGTTLTQTDRVLGPGDFSFADGQREHPVQGASTLTPNALAFGPMLKGSYDIQWRSAIIRPSLALRADVLSPVKDWSWSSIAVVGRVALLFDITPEPEPVIVADTQVSKPEDIVVVRERPRLSASIQMFGVDTNGTQMKVAKVHVDEALIRRNVPLLPAVFFDQNASDLPARYIRRDAEKAKTFKVDELANLDILATQYHMLDIVGSRLAASPSTKVVLHGSTSRDEAAGLGRQRASTVAQYLQETWGIAPERMQIREGNGPLDRSNESTEDGREDNRRVEIGTTNDAVTAPAVTEQILREFDPPLLRLLPSYEAEAGLSRWDLKVTHGARTVAQYSSHDSNDMRVPELTWDLAAEALDRELPPINAELAVQDATGATATARGTVPLVLDKQVHVVNGQVVRSGNQEQVIYTLVGFNYNTAELDRNHRVVMESIAGSIRSGASIKITGFTDRIGEEQRNAELSQERATSVSTALARRLEARGITNASIEAKGGGVETIRFGSELPEARALSRGVYVVVDQTVEGK